MINDLHKCLKWSLAILYADDTTIIAKGRNLKYLRLKMQRDLDSLSNWLRTNKLCLNVKKTKFVIFTLKPYSGNVELVIDNEAIEHVDEFKFLGFNLDGKLSCESQYSSLRAKLLGVDYIIRKLHKCVPLSCLRMLYYAYFHSHLTYGMTVWGGLLKKEYINKLFILQKSVIRHMFGVNPTTHCMPLFKKLRILTLHDQLNQEYVKLIFRVSNKLLSTPVINMFKKSTGIQTRNRNVICEKFMTSRTCNCFLVKSIKILNSMSQEIKDAPSVKVLSKRFKNKCISTY